MDSRSPSPKSKKFADDCLIVTGDDAKRPRSPSATRTAKKMVVAETFFAEGDNSYTPPFVLSARDTPAIVPETPTHETLGDSLIPSSQTDSVVAAAVPDDTGPLNSDNEVSEHEEAAHVLSTEIPPEWTAGKAVAVHWLSVCENLYSL
jgi:hypothetical protein